MLGFQGTKTKRQREQGNVGANGDLLLCEQIMNTYNLAHLLLDVCSTFIYRLFTAKGNKTLSKAQEEKIV